MSIINELKLSKQTVEAYRTIFEAQTQKLDGVIQEIRQIDPQLLGEKRYEDNAHWAVTKRVYDFCYRVKNFFRSSKIAELTQTKTNYEGAVNLLGKTLRRHEDAHEILHEILQTSTLVHQETALRLVTKQIADLQETIKKSAYRWPLNYVMPANNMASDVAALESKKALCEKELAETKAFLNQTDAAPQVEITFEKLTISEGEKSQIGKLIPSVANDYFWTLLGKYFELKAAQKKLQPLHPLKSLEFIFNHHREDLVKISNQPQRWIGIPGKRGFKPETADKMKDYHEKGTIIPCLPGFAKSLGLTQAQHDQLTAQAKAGKWEDFVQSLADFART